MNSRANTITAFISYAHKDEALLDDLRPHLATLKRQGLIQTWDDRQITGGTDWAQAIDDNLKTADIILLLISADFINSDYCWSIELEQAIQRHETGSARVIPIILRPVDWEGTPFKKLQAFPKGGKPVTEWDNKDRAYVDIAKGIRKVVEELRTQREQMGQTPAATVTKTVTLHVHGWVRETYDTQPDQELDWTPYFHQNFARPEIPRKIASPEFWRTDLYPRLEDAREELTQNQSGITIDLRGRLPLTAALAIGKVFPITGHTIQVNQFIQGKNYLWRSDATGANLSFREEVLQPSCPGPNLLLAISIGRPIKRDVQKLYTSPKYAFDAGILLQSKKGFLESAAEANSLAEDVTNRLRNQYLDEYQPELIYLVLLCPQSFAVFLGQRLRFLGQVATYEHQPTAEECYVPSVVLNT